MKNKFDLQDGLDQFKYPTSDVDSLNLPYEVVLPFVNIDSSRIEDELTNHASKYAYLAYFVAESQTRSAMLKNDIDALRGALFIEAKSNTTLKVTDEMAKAMVQSNADLLELRQNLAECEAVEVYWKNVIDAMQSRGFLLKELANRDMKERLSPNATQAFEKYVADVCSGKTDTQISTETLLTEISNLKNIIR